MKKTTLFTIFFLAALSLSAQNKNFMIEVSIGDAPAGAKYVFGNRAEGINDTITLKKEGEKVKYSHAISTPMTMQVAYIASGEKRAKTGLNIYVEAGNTIKINGSVNTFAQNSLSGGIYDNAVIEKIRTQEALQAKHYADYRKAMGEKNDAAAKEASDAYDAVEETITTLEYEYVKQNPASVYSAVLLSQNLRGDINVIEPLYNALSAEVKESQVGKTVGERIPVIKAIQVGKPAPDFTLNDINGEKITLSQFKGRWVLLDFWGSWCIWCRRGNPSLVNLYDKYGGEDFEIIGIACRDKIEDWKKAIKDDGLEWRHANVSQTEGGNKLPSMYNISGYPSKILIDPDGLISVISIGYHETDDPVVLKMVESLGEVYVK
ncbi:MAG: TlpA family protein disulfide reductase [Flavobacteriales bacterium]|nr:TlpA family protein disulfide reductase [Flavobacteriales bacterium]